MPDLLKDITDATVVIDTAAGLFKLEGESTLRISPALMPIRSTLRKARRWMGLKVEINLSLIPPGTCADGNP